jgi:hypothetical protein
MKDKVAGAGRIAKSGLWLGLICFAWLLVAAQPAAAQGFGSTARIQTLITFDNSSLWRAQQSVEQVTNQGRALSGTSNGAVSSSRMVAPLRPYPINATDFRTAPNRLTVDELADATPNLTRLQKEGLRTLYHQFLTDFEKDARKNNVANSLAFVVGVSLMVVGREISEAEADRLVLAYNNILANLPQFNAMPPQQKQILYECLVITGGSIGFLHGQGIQQKDAAMQLQAREMAKAVLKSFAGITVQ